jgi:hypothetical protein
MNYLSLHFGPSLRYLLMLNGHRLIAANNSCPAYGTGRLQQRIQERSYSFGLSLGKTVLAA